MKMDFADTITDYLSWKVRFRGFLAGRTPLPEPELFSHENSMLGKWLYSEGISRYGAIPEILKLAKIHRNLHRSVWDLVRKKQAFGGVSPLKDEIMKFELLFMNFFCLLDTLRRTLK